MPVTNNVLVPLDGSTLAEAALDVASEMVRAAGGSLTLFIVTYAETAAPLREFAESEEVSTSDAAAIYLDQVADRLADDGVHVHQVTALGSNVAEEIVAHTEGTDVSMIVMTSHGRSGVGRWLLGGVTDKVIRISSVPVLVVPVRT